MLSPSFFTVCSLQVISFIFHWFIPLLLGIARLEQLFISNEYFSCTILSIPYFWSTYNNTSSLTTKFFIVGFIPILLQFLHWSHNISCWNKTCHNRGKSICSVQNNTILSNYTVLYYSAWLYKSMFLLSLLLLYCFRIAVFKLYFFIDSIDLCR